MQHVERPDRLLRVEALSRWAGLFLMTGHSGSSQMRKEKECLWLCGMKREFVNVGKERAGLSPVVPQLQPTKCISKGAHQDGAPRA